MGRSCGCENKCSQCACSLIDVNSITVTTDTSFVLNVNPKVFVNNKEYILRICQLLPVLGESGIEPVTILSNGTSYPALDSIGNVLLAGRLRGNRCYRVIFGDNVPHFIVCNTRKCLEYNANAASPEIPVEQFGGETISEVLKAGGGTDI